jgi:hypothetical protein
LNEEDVREKKIAESIHTLCKRETNQVKLENKLHNVNNQINLIWKIYAYFSISVRIFNGCDNRYFHQKTSVD